MTYPEIVQARLTTGWHDRHPDGQPGPPAVTRLIPCVNCGQLEHVYDASSPSLGTHHWVERRSNTCPDCQHPAHGPVKPWWLDTYRRKLQVAA